MSTWPAFVVLVLVIFVALAPRQVLGPVVGLVGRYFGAGVAAVIAFGAAVWTLHDNPSEYARLVAYAELALGAICAAWWLYRVYRPLYRDQAPTSESPADDR